MDVEQVTDRSKGSTTGIAVLEFGVQVSHSIVCSYMAHKFVLHLKGELKQHHTIIDKLFNR